jgi:hypothetical protein
MEYFRRTIPTLSTEKKPTAKKKLRPSIVVWKAKKEQEQIEAKIGLDKIYYKYFAENGCKLFVDLSVNEWSIADALFLSGSSMVLVEFKKRYEKSYTYPSAMLEKDKYANLMTVGKLLNASVLYLNEWIDGVITGWWLSPDKNYLWENQYSQVSDGSTAKENKEVTYLSFEDCALIISMKTYNRISWLQLNNYFISKR